MSRDYTPATDESLDRIAGTLDRIEDVLERIADAVEELAEQGRGDVPPEVTP